MNRQQMLEKVENLSAYEVKDRRFVEEMNSEGMVLEHRKSGARLFLMSNEDDNKVFSIGFRTPPADSTGLPHILEHSVLEGSEKFPVKDPFVELVKGSLNTFLNAMTYPDKTIIIRQTAISIFMAIWIWKKSFYGWIKNIYLPMTKRTLP